MAQDLYKKVDLNSFQNKDYNPGANKLKIVLWFFVNALFFRNPLNPSSKLKIVLLKLFGSKLGKNLTIKPGINIKYPWYLEIGDHSWIGENVWIDNLVMVKIGAHVCLSQGAMLLTGNHNYKTRSFDLITGEIVIEEGVWIGAKSIVCPGVKCYSHAVLSVCSVANQDLKAFTIYKGNPAKESRIRKVEN